MGVVSCLHGGDHFGIDQHLAQQLDRLVPSEWRMFNYHRFDMRVPAQRFLAWDTARTEPWGVDQTRMVIWDHAEALDGLKGSGRFKEGDDLDSPSSKGNKLATLQTHETVARSVSRRSSNVHLFVVLRDAEARSRGVLVPLVDEARDDGRLLEFTKSAYWDKDGRTSRVQRIAQGLGLLLEQDCAEVLADQLGEEDDGHQIAQELRKLKLWASSTGGDFSPALVGELCSRGAVSPLAWAKEAVAKPRSQRRFLQLTAQLSEQGVPLMDLLGALLREGRQALLFKVLDDAGADQATIATILGWSNPRRYFPIRRELSRSSVSYLRCLMESALQWRERVLQGAVKDESQALRLLVVEWVREFDPFELRK